MAKVQKRFCILGCQHGHISSVINGLAGLGWELEFIADRDPWLAEKLCEKHGAPLEKDWRRALRKSSSAVAAVAAVNCAKGEMIEAALLAGKHVVADKPLVIEMKDLRRVERAIKKSKRKAWALLTLRYSPACRALKALVDSGELGEMVSAAGFRPHRLGPENRPRWMFNDRKYGGVIVDLLCHDIDFFLWLAGSRAQKVSASEGSFRHKGIADCGTVFLKLTRGVTGLFRADWLTPREYPAHGDCRFFVTGTEGSAELRFAGDPLNVGGAPRRAQDAAVSSPNGGAELIVYSDRRAPEKVELVSGFPSFYEEFTRFAEGGEEPVLKSGQVIESMRATIAARESAKKGRPVRIKS